MGVSKKHCKNSEVFRRFFLTYIIVLIVPFLLFLLMVFSLTGDIKNNSVRESQYVLKSVRDKIDHKMERAYSNILSFNYDVAMKNMLHQDTGYQDITDIHDVMSEIAYMEQSGDRILIYFPEDDILVSSKGVYSRLEEIYGKIFAYGDMDYQSFRENILMCDQDNVFFPAADVKMDAAVKQKILYLRQVPFGIKSPDNARVLFYIDCGYIDDQMNAYLKNSGSQFGIYDDTGSPLYVSEKNRESMSTFVSRIQNGENIEKLKYHYADDVDNTFYTASKSNFNGWLYVSGIEKKELFGGLYKVQRQILFVFFIYAVLGCVLSYYIASKNLRPLYRLLSMWKGTDTNKGTVNEYKMLESYMQEMISENQQLTDTNDDYQKKMRSVWMHNLVTGKYDTDEEIRELELPLIEDYRNFQVMLLDFSAPIMSMEEQSVGQFNSRKYFIEKKLAELSLEHGILVEINICQTAVLFYSNDPLKEMENKVYTICKHIHRTLEEEKQDCIKIGCGEAVTGSLYIGYSFVQAKCAIRACMEYQKDYMEYQTFPRQDERYYFPSQLRDMLVESLKNGNLKQAKGILKILNIENFEARNLSRVQKKQFMEEMDAFLVHVINKGLVKSDTAVPEMSDEQDRFYALVKILLDACMRRTEAAFEQKKTVQQNLTQYVDEHYQDSNLCLSMVAEHFHMSESYVSYLFKKTNQVNFSAYLENKRIEEAKVLLLQKKGTIDEIREMVGYNSAHVFRRAFRKVTGVNPSDIAKL